MGEARVLVADDEKEILTSCRKILERAGHQVTTAADGIQALEQLKASRFDLFLVDLRMPGRNGLEILAMAQALDPAMMTVMFTAFATVETAVEAVKRGAFDYLPKPFTADQLRLTAERALKQKHLQEENLNLREQLAVRMGFDRILGTSEAMQSVFRTLQKVMRTDANILILGETGTGKELLARTIHAHSFRNNKPFVPVDCAALPENLLESELFGHEKGAFTGADQAKRGLLEVAEEGTVFLDEIGELPLGLQAKLLRTLQERELRRLGGDKPLPINIRILAATSRDIPAQIAHRNFREDLFYRLNVVTVHLPALRDRREDIPGLANHFLEQYSRQDRRAANRFSPDVTKLFLTYPWPGNVRELQNIVHHAVLMTEGESVTFEDLPESLKGQFPREISFQDIRQQQAQAVEKSFLVELLHKYEGNVSEAASEAKMTRKMIYRLARKFGLDLDQFRNKPDHHPGKSPLN